MSTFLVDNITQEEGLMLTRRLNEEKHHSVWNWLYQLYLLHILSQSLYIPKYNFVLKCTTTEWN